MWYCPPFDPLHTAIYYTLLSYGGGFVNDNGWALLTRLLAGRTEPFLLSDDVAVAVCLICSKVALRLKYHICVNYDLIRVFNCIKNWALKKTATKLKSKLKLKIKIQISNLKENGNFRGKNKAQLNYIQHAVNSNNNKKVKLHKTTIWNTVTVSEACIHTHTDKQINNNLDTLHSLKCTHFCLAIGSNWSATSG